MTTKKRNLSGLIGMVLLITALLCAGCSSTAPAGTGTAASQQGKTFTLQSHYIDEEGRIKEIAITTTVILPSGLGLEMVGEPVQSFYETDMNGYQQFLVDIKNTGSSSVTITGARITQNGKAVTLDYANYVERARVPVVSIPPEQTRRCSWISPEKVRGDQNHVVEIFATTSGGAGTAKAQTGTTVKSTSVSTTTTPTVKATPTPAAAATQVAKEYFAAVWREDSQAVKERMTPYLLEDVRQREAKKPGLNIAGAIKKTLQQKGVTDFRITEELKVDGTLAHGHICYLNEQGECWKEEISLSYINNQWKINGLY